MPTFLAESIGWISTSLFLISILLPRSRPILALGIFAAFLSIPLQAMPKKKRCLAAIADVVSRETIEAAQAAETSPPSGRLSISLSDQGVPTPAISSIDWAPLIGKRIDVELKTSQGIFEVPQLVISMAFLDTHGKDVVSR